MVSPADDEDNRFFADLGVVDLAWVTLGEVSTATSGVAGVADMDDLVTVVGDWLGGTLGPERPTLEGGTLFLSGPALDLERGVEVTGGLDEGVAVPGDLVGGLESGVEVTGGWDKGVAVPEGLVGADALPVTGLETAVLITGSGVAALERDVLVTAS